MKRALILAAGLGTRLGEPGQKKPKPLWPICNIPLIRFALALLKNYGITEVAINLHHHGEQIQDELGDGSGDGVAILYAPEETLLGTGGPIVKLRDFLTQDGRESFFVINGKILIELDLDAVKKQHEATGAIATMVLRETADAKTWGAIETDDHGRVVKILDVGVAGSHQSMFTGVHLISPEFVKQLPALPAASDSIRQGYQPLLQAGAPIYGYAQTGYFQEHSTVERYLEGNWRALAGEAAGVITPQPLTGITPDVNMPKSVKLVPPYVVGFGATIGEGATVGPFAVIGAGSQIAAGSSISHSVAWPNVKVTSDVSPHSLLM